MYIFTRWPKIVKLCWNVRKLEDGCNNVVLVYNKKNLKQSIFSFLKCCLFDGFKVFCTLIVN